LLACAIAKHAAVLTFIDGFIAAAAGHLRLPVAHCDLAG